MRALKTGILLTIITILFSCSPKPQPISRGYKSNNNYHKSPARTYSGPNSGNYYNR
jgi:hypothetical protein